MAAVKAPAGKVESPPSPFKAYLDAADITVGGIYTVVGTSGLKYEDFLKLESIIALEGSYETILVFSCLGTPNTVRVRWAQVESITTR